MIDIRDRDHSVFSQFVEWMREETGTIVPVKFVVCPTCEGKGTHVNPSIDAHGIGAEEWSEWDEDDRERYLNGGYDVSCAQCGGNRVVEAMDAQRASQELTNQWEQWERGHWESEAETQAERRLGA